MSLLALIPARAGSKGLPDKNIRPLCGRPLLAWSILAAQESGICDEIHVSTDSEVYAQVAKDHGAQVPFLRPAALALDSSSTDDVIVDVLDRYASIGKTFDAFLLLQPTSPLRRAEDILGAVQLFQEKGASSVIGVCEMEHSPLWANTLPPDHSMAGFLSPEIQGRPRQSLPTYYRLNGALYLARMDVWRESHSFYGPGSFAYIMPRERSTDIDTLFDFRMADAILKNEP